MWSEWTWWFRVALYFALPASFKRGRIGFNMFNRPLAQIERRGYISEEMLAINIVKSKLNQVDKGLAPACTRCWGWLKPGTGLNSFNYSAIGHSRGVPVQGCVLIAVAIVFRLSSDPTHLRQLGGPGHHLRQQRDEPAWHRDLRIRLWLHAGLLLQAPAHAHLQHRPGPPHLQPQGATAATTALLLVVASNDCLSTGNSQRWRYWR